MPQNARQQQIIDAPNKTVVATVKIGKGPGFPMFSPVKRRRSASGALSSPSMMSTWVLICPAAAQLASWVIASPKRGAKVKTRKPRMVAPARTRFK